MSAKALLVRTILGDQLNQGDEGPLLLAGVQGFEGMSIPFSYDLTLYRAPEKGDIDPSLLTNTTATFGILRKTGSYVWRTGVFEYFEKTGTTEIASEKRNDFIVYRARLVPQFKMLDAERTFRVFEGMTVLQIVREVMADFPNMNPDYYLKTTFGAADRFPPIDYCVQFNEPSFDFISRLLATFGIWYVFDHRHPEDPSSNETMVLGHSLALPMECEEPEMAIKADDPDEDSFGDFRRVYQMPHKKVRVGDFNVLAPASPVWGEALVTRSHDMTPGEPDAEPRFRRDAFPGPAPRFDPKGSLNAAGQDATAALANEEARAFTVQGQSKNRTFLAGRTFQITKDESLRGKLTKGDDPFGEPTGRRYLITRLSIAAVERGIGRTFWGDVANFWNPWHWFVRDNQGKDKPGVDTMSAVAAAPMTGWLQDEAKHVASPTINPIDHAASFAGGAMGVLGNVVQILGSSLKEAWNNHSDDYGNSVVAVPWDAGAFSRIPLPLATPAVAHGPHLAVVVGPKGTDATGQDVYVDALGRVRVRFPWHRVLPRESTASAGETDPWKTDRRTAWVRVAEGWAGQGFGTQFVPRIGDEVVVSFIDGDPSRPVITGRMYNARSGPSGLPFAATGSKPGEIKDDYVHTPKATADGAAGPNDQTLRSGIRTRTTPDNGKGGFNMVRFDDTADQEQLLLRAQGRLDVTALRGAYHTTYGDLNVLVKKGKDAQGNPVGGGMLISTESGYGLTVSKGRAEDVGGDYNLTVKGDVKCDLQGNASAVVKTAFTVNAATIVLEAKEKLTLKVGGNFVVIDASGVAIHGTLVQINSGGSPGSTSDLTMADAAAPAMADPGDPPDWLAQQPKGGGGGHGGGKSSPHVAVAQHGPVTSSSASNPDLLYVGGQQKDKNQLQYGDPPK